jgi:hypothetical protein
MKTYIYEDVMLNQLVLNLSNVGGRNNYLGTLDLDIKPEKKVVTKEAKVKDCYLGVPYYWNVAAEEIPKTATNIKVTYEV